MSARHLRCLWLPEVNAEQFLPVSAPGETTQVLCTSHGNLGGGAFLDPSNPRALLVDHMKQVCVGTKPLDVAQRAKLGSEPARVSVHEAMVAYAAARLSAGDGGAASSSAAVHAPPAVVTTYGSAGEATRITCCVSRLNVKLRSYWAGQWRAQWTLENFADGESGRLDGWVAIDVHYFEDGNVQMHEKFPFSDSIRIDGDVGAAFAARVGEFEAQLMANLEETFASLGKNALDHLRRRLPITKQKFDWDNQAGRHKLARDLKKKVQVS